MTAWEFRQLIEQKGNLAAAREVSPSVCNKEQADLIIWEYVIRLLTVGEYGAAGLVLWGPRVWNPRPASVQKILNTITSSAKIFFQGCGSVGKSYTPIIWLLLDWLLDPKYTNVKIVSTTKGHATSNTFTTLVKLHRAACIKLPGIVTSDYIGLDARERDSGLAVVGIPVGDDGKGRLQGFHPKPREKAHPLFGDSTRARLDLDECEEAPNGLWEGVDNFLVALDGVQSIKVIGAYNPKDRASRTANLAEPPEGWDAVDVETGLNGKDEWLSKEGWTVVRIDGKKTENVRSKKLMFPGMMSYSGYRELETKDGGNSVSYYTFARGIYPPEGAVGILISSKLWNDCLGEYVFTGVPVNCAGVDTAVDGRDNCVFTFGKKGMATAFRKVDGTLVKFKEPRMVAQAEQQYTLKKGSVKIVGDEIRAMCLKLNVSSENLAIDATGNGSAVYSYLCIPDVMGADVIGVNFNANASETRILQQDQYTPYELYEMMVSEVCFALARWMEFGFCVISPGIRREPLHKETTSRRYVLGAGKKLRVERKDDYKKRMGSTSPDFFDSLTIWLAGIRMRDALMGSMVDTEKKLLPPPRPQHDPYATAEWMDGGV